VKNDIFNSFSVNTIDDEIEGILWLEFSAKKSNICFCVVVCYLPPADTCKPVDAEVFFQNLLRQIYCYQHKGNIFICGDMNARVGLNSDYIEGVDLVSTRNIIDYVENKQGDAFVNFLSDVNFCMLNGSFNNNDYTCISATGKSVVDYICVPYENIDSISDFKIISMSSIINDIAYIPESIPDHSLLYCDFKTSVKLETKSNIANNHDNKNTKYKVTNVPNDFLVNDEIRQKLLQTIDKIENYIKTENDIQHAYDEFENLIKDEMKNKLSTYKCNSGIKRKNYKPYWNDELGNQWSKVCETEKAWLRFKGPNCRKRTLKDVYCFERKTFDKLNRKYKRKYQVQQQQKLEDKLNSANRRDFWKSIGKIGIGIDRKRTIPLEVVDNDGNVTMDKKAVLDKWKGDFESLFKQNDIRNDNLDETTFDTLIDVSVLNEPITRDEVLQAILHAKLRKASGIDDIPAEVLKNDTAVDLLFQIISASFDLGKVPLQWNSGVINPILKPGSDDDRLPLNYRGITLISVPCKIYCYVLNRRLSAWLEENNILCDEQNGFRRERSCEEHIHSLYSVLNDRKISRKSSFVCFVDMRKAFDTVEHYLLWFKLQRAGLRGKFLTAIQSLYNDLKCTVRVNNELTPWFEVEAGVKQGCILCPSLFSVYINDLAERINSLNCGITVDDIQLSILLYADDIALIAPDENSLQSMLNAVSEWCSTWKLSINVNKTKIIHFRPQSIRKSEVIFQCSDYIIEYCDSYKYLGVWMNEHLNFSKHTKELAKAASRALGSLMSKMVDTGGLTYNVYTKLYSSTVEPILMYGSGIWGIKQFSCITAVQNRACKYFLTVGKHTSNIATRGDMGWTSCFTKQRINFCRLLCKLIRTDNSRKSYKIWKWIPKT